jgi:hypothetical protein
MLLVRMHPDSLPDEAGLPCLPETQGRVMDAFGSRTASQIPHQAWRLRLSACACFKEFGPTAALGHARH